MHTSNIITTCMRAQDQPGMDTLARTCMHTSTMRTILTQPASATGRSHHSSAAAITGFGCVLHCNSGARKQNPTAQLLAPCMFFQCKWQCRHCFCSTSQQLHSEAIDTQRDLLMAPLQTLQQGTVMLGLLCQLTGQLESTLHLQRYTPTQGNQPVHKSAKSIPSVAIPV